MNICVIGGSGFVGTHLIKKLKANHEITIIDKEPSEAFPELVEQGDIRDRDFLNQSWVQTILIL
jgi:nucleoside-diphosphate-sugar epimerase